MNLLEEKEREGRLEDYEAYIESVVDLRDKLEFYLLTGAPGQAFEPTEADSKAARMAAELLENA